MDNFTNAPSLPTMTFSALVVDDEPSILTTFSAILQTKNFQVKTASSSAIAKQQLLSSTFDLVLTDMSMETSSAGFDVVKVAKSRPYKPAVVIVSAFPDLSADWKRYGADAMFHKPTLLSELLVAIDGLMKMREARMR